MKKTFKFIAVIAALCVFSLTFAGCGIDDTTALATVNGEEITREDFMVYFNSMQNTMLNEAGIMTIADANKYWESGEIDGKSAADVARERALDEVIRIKIKCQKAVEQGLALTEDDRTAIDEQITQITNSIGGMEAYKKELAAIGMTPESYKAVTEDAYLAAKIDQQYYTDEEGQPSDDEIKSYMKANYVKAKHILIATKDLTTGADLDEAQKTAAKEKADSLLQQIKDGADFDTLMTENTEDTGITDYPDGYTFTKDEMVEAFETAAFALKEGEISEVVESDFGYHIIKREPLDLSEEGIAELKESVVSIIISNKIEQQVDKWVEEADIKINKKALARIEVTKLEEAEATPDATQPAGDQVTDTTGEDTSNPEDANQTIDSTGIDTQEDTIE